MTLFRDIQYYISHDEFGGVGVGALTGISNSFGFSNWADEI